MDRPDYSSFNSKALHEILDDAGLLHNDRSRTSYILTCPRCNKSKKLYIRKKDGRFVCWRCRETDGFAGRPEYALTELTGMSISTIRQRLYGFARAEEGGDTLDITLDDFFEEGDEIDEDAYEFVSIPWEWDCYRIDQPEATKGADYLAARGISMEVALQYDLRYQPRRRRVLFPVVTGGRLLGWQGRYISDTLAVNDLGELVETPKVLSTREIPRDRTFMFADRIVGSEHAVLCEGPVDALKAHLCGGNVASMGKAVSQAQINRLRNAGIKRLYFALDPDAASETGRLVRELADDLECYWMVPPKPYKDLGEMPMEQVYNLFRNAERVFGDRLFVFLPRID